MEKIKDGVLLGEVHISSGYHAAISKNNDGKFVLVVGRMDCRYKDHRIAPVDRHEHIISNPQQFITDVTRVLSDPTIWKEEN